LQRELGEKYGITPDHIFTIDPWGPDVATAIDGVTPVTNFYQRSGFLQGWMLEGQNVENVSVGGFGHFDITEADTVVSSIKREICQTKGRK
jgi:hypothetical protein